MTKYLLFLATAVLSGFAATAQSSKGLVAHWEMSGDGLDASGKGHNGTMSGLTPASGRAGVANSALYFDGVASHISVPFQQDLNLKQYSLCATVSVSNFNSSQCQSNYILSRDNQFTPGSYSLNFFENPFNDCQTFDPTKEVFAAEAGSLTGSHADWRYTPNIVANEWYSVVATWDGGTFRIYVNGVKMATNPVPGAVPLTNSSAGILIGRLSTTGGYQYPFAGIMDDLRIYNRVLCDNEIVAYNTSTLPLAPKTTVTPDCEDLVDSNNLSVRTPGLENISLYPNPASSSITIEGDVQGASYRIVNALGQIAASGTLAASTPVVSIATLVPGMYYLRLSRGSYNSTLKFIRE